MACNDNANGKIGIKRDDISWDLLKGMFAYLSLIMITCIPNLESIS